MSKKEFTVFGLNANKISVLYGALLIIFVFILLLSNEIKFVTSYTPAVLGVLIFIFGLFSLLVPERQKLFMHINVVIGSFVFLYGLSAFVSLFYGTITGVNFWNDFLRLSMSVTGAIYILICIKSFIFARK